MPRHMRVEPQRLVTPDVLRGVEREYHDLVISLRALAALLREPDPDGSTGEPVLARILDSELNQLDVLVGELTAALRLEAGEIGPTQPVDLARALSSAVRRSGNRVLAEMKEEAVVAGHPLVVGRAVAGAVALALRIAEGRVVATASTTHAHGVVSIRVPAEGESRTLTRFGPRVTLLRRIVAAEGGRLTLERSRDHLVIRLAFPVRREIRLSQPSFA